jgi:hypothetical protein
MFALFQKFDALLNASTIVPLQMRTVVGSSHIRCTLMHECNARLLSCVAGLFERTKLVF